MHVKTACHDFEKKFDFILIQVDQKMQEKGFTILRHARPNRFK